MSQTAPVPPPQIGRRRRLVPMRGRDPHERSRVATPLELLFDLTFVVAVGQAATQLAHFVAEGHLAAGLGGFGFCTFAVCWAWINFSWFASAYDTDDWVFRLATMVQMVGVLVLALGVPQLFRSMDVGGRFDDRIIVLGYVIMRLAMVFQWLRAARQDAGRRKQCVTYAKSIVIAQVGWIAVAVVPIGFALSAACALLLILIEFTGPVIAERYRGGTPWHAHHIAERYSLFTIIALGEGVVGTVATLSAITDSGDLQTFDVIGLGIAGIGLTFGLWWSYFLLPSGPLLHAHRDRSFGWGYGHIIIFGAIIATGAGLHVAALSLDRQSAIGPVETILALAVPVGSYVLALYAIHLQLTRTPDRLHLWLFAATIMVLAVAIWLAAAGAPIPICLVVVMLAPWVTVLGYEFKAYEHNARIIANLKH